MPLSCIRLPSGLNGSGLIRTVARQPFADQACCQHYQGTLLERRRGGARASPLSTPRLVENNHESKLTRAKPEAAGESRDEKDLQLNNANTSGNPIGQSWRRSEQWRAREDLLLPHPPHHLQLPGFWYGGS